MLNPADASSLPTAPSGLAPLGDWLRRVVRRPAQPQEVAALQGSTDLADLERRLRHLERGRPERFAPLPPLPLPPP
ncbi:MAG: DUF3563 domain-containing protein [Burkholderiales bacterium]|nr:MAG: DUF3563 domain-containing protein [Burkholderiales bacterium]